MVFKYKGSITAQFTKYILLVAVSGTISGFSISLLKQVLGISAVVIKAAAELVLYFMNYYVQRVWVFTKDKKEQEIL